MALRTVLCIATALSLAGCGEPTPAKGEADARRACDKIAKYEVGYLGVYAFEFDEDAQAAAAVNPDFGALASRTSFLREFKGKDGQPSGEDALVECERLFPDDD